MPGGDAIVGNPERIDLNALLRESDVSGVLEQLDRELVGLAPVKRRIREIAAYLLVSKARRQLGLETCPPSLHLCFTGNPGTGKTTVATRMADILHRLGYVRKGHLVAVTRDDLVGQYIGHTAPKTKEVLKRAMGGVLFIDEAYYLYRPENERDYGQEAIEILLQVMENHRDDLVVILAGYHDRMDRFFESNPGMSSRIAHHIDFPDYGQDELFQIGETMLKQMNYRLDEAGAQALIEYIARRVQRPNFANARSIRNALDRARLRQANRLFGKASAAGQTLGAPELSLLDAADFRGSRVFNESPPRTDLTMRLYSGRTTLSKFLIDQLQDQPDHGQLAGLLVDVAAAIKAIAVATAKGALADTSNFATTQNVQGEQQVPLDVLADELMIEHCEWSGLLAGMASEERELPVPIRDEFQRGPYLLVFDPLDGSSNVAMNVSIGTIFSVLCHAGREPPGVNDFLQPGTAQVAAGYAIYGPATMLVITVGKGVHGFTLDREIGNFVLTHPDIRIPEETSEFAINTSNERFWEPPVQRYVAECKAGSAGIRARDFNMRWIATMVAEVHRILMRGGVFMYPQDLKQPRRPGRLRLMYEANPMAMLVEQAGGRASTGRQRLLDLLPESLHQRVPVILGSQQEIARIESYHEAFDQGTDKPYVSPLFRTRSLYRAEA